MNEFLLKSYDYELPLNLIANEPQIPKEKANLLVFERKTEWISHHKFGDLPEILPPCDIIFNDTKVIKARLFGEKLTGGKIELLINQPLSQNRFSCYIRGKVAPGIRLKFENDLSCEILECLNDGLRIVRFFKFDKVLGTAELYKESEKIGFVPLPPYIKRAANENDEKWYQSVFAKTPGAVAAPTASLHFSNEILSNLKKSHDFYYLTLHVGAGTFKGVECENIKEHKMHGEIYEIPANTAEIIKSERAILGVGTTATRCIENYARNGQKSGICELFLNPGNQPIRQDFLLTNFHLPKSTLLMLVASFVGLENLQKIYKIAVEKNYKFYSYGDAMLII